MVSHWIWVPSLPLSFIIFFCANPASWIFLGRYTYEITWANMKSTLRRFSCYTDLLFCRKKQEDRLQPCLHSDSLIWNARSPASVWMKTTLRFTKWAFFFKRPFSASGLLGAGCECTSLVATCCLGQRCRKWWIIQFALSTPALRMGFFHQQLNSCYIRKFQFNHIQNKSPSMTCLERVYTIKSTKSGPLRTFTVST